MPTAQRNLTDPASASSFTFRDNWTSGSSYSVNDVVPHSNGNTYVCVQAHTADSTNEPHSGGSWSDYWSVWAAGVSPGSTVINPSFQGYSEEALDFGPDISAGVYTVDIFYSYQYWTAQNAHLTLDLPIPAGSAANKARSIVFEISQDDTGGHGISVVADGIPARNFSEQDEYNLSPQMTNIVVATWSPARQLWGYRITGDIDLREAGIYVDDFESHATGAPPSGWTDRWHTANSTWQVVDDAVSGGKVLQLTATNDDESRFLSFDAVNSDPNRGDQEILAMFRCSPDEMTNDDPTMLRFYLRGGGTYGTHDGYAFHLLAFYDAENPRQMELIKYEDGTIPIRNIYHPFEWTDTSRIIGRFRANGDQIMGRVWIPADPNNPLADEPSIWQMELTDAGGFIDGWVGVGGYDDQGSRIFEWVSVATNGGRAPLPDGI